MKPLIALFSILSIAFNTALAGVGTVILCEHIEGDSHLVIETAHGNEELGDCCDHGAGIGSHSSEAEDDCSDCFDTEIDTNTSDEALSSVERVKVKAPQTLFLNLAHATIDFPKARFYAELLPERSPLVATGASYEYVATVQFRC